ncbi:unnamed protein product [Protopolystoma xenopodis]|uniref:Uncharacterized protein n=1 Tax=Protopolystoma xenopodis TaxID=117903 RepID=A0A448X804_9PLAT|nr:unnamed protein product [Protopolystoma xenopodis]
MIESRSSHVSLTTTGLYDNAPDPAASSSSSSSLQRGFHGDLSNQKTRRSTLGQSNYVVHLILADKVEILLALTCTKTATRAPGTTISDWYNHIVRNSNILEDIFL